MLRFYILFLLFIGFQTGYASVPHWQDLIEEDQPIIEPRKMCLIGRVVHHFETKVECAEAQQAAGKVRDENGFLDGIEFKGRWDLFDGELFSGLMGLLQYEFGVEPSIGDDYFMRFDRYRLEFEARGSDWISELKDDEGDDVKFGLELVPGAEIVFGQRFEKMKDARRIGNGYLPTRMPLTAEKAINRLKAGDYVIFRAYANFLVGAHVVNQLNPTIQVKAGVAYILSGRYEIHISRLNDNKVRVRVLGRHGDEKRGEIRFGVGPDFEVFGIDRLDDRFIHLRRLNKLLSFDWNRNKSTLALFDYTLDLDDPRARHAYDQLLSSSKKLKTFKLMNPIKGDEKLKKLVLSNVKPIEELAQESLIIADPHDRPADQNFKGNNQSLAGRKRLNLSLGVFNFESRRIYRENFLEEILRGEDGVEFSKFYLQPSWTTRKKHDFIFRRSYKKVMRHQSSLYAADSERHPMNLENLRYTFFMKDLKYRAKDHKNFQQDLKDILPDNIFANLKAKMIETGWWSRVDRRRGNIFIEFGFNAEAFKSADKSRLSDKKSGESFLREDICQYLADLEPIESTTNSVLMALTVPEVGSLGVSREQKCTRLERKIRKMAIHLREALADDRDPLQRYEGFKKLRKSSLYREIAPGYMGHLLDKLGGSVNDNIFFTVEINAAGHEEFEFTHGEMKDLEILDTLRFIEALYSDDPDLLRSFGGNFGKMLKNTTVFLN